MSFIQLTDIRLAVTSSSDVVAILVFATVVFLILAGIVSLVKWIVRLANGKPNPAKLQTAILVLESDCRADDEDEAGEEIVRFALFLHSKLADGNTGRLSEVLPGAGEWHLCFEGPDANRIWGILGDDVKDCSPNKPLRVILKPTRKTSSEQTIHSVPWHPIRKFDLPKLPNPEILGKWIRLAGLGRVLSITGIVGILGWKILRYSSGQTENEFRQTQLGNISANLVGGILIFGLFLALVSSLRIRSITRNLDYISWETPRENTLKYVLLIVIAIFGVILFLI